ncbi:hypothetical protein [Pelagerythrobacter rhizovicinus]|uniref:DUF885 domain-containing protein n=1 Tax=Pelagerythrobacter rhizovicinus TaxID=2268576 RepID=A0A4Q2KG26_9SPHN|nr:hypothetical protein [Pelagerythrobacter rhizovicinus]RXZ63984.1 hypothetical protein ETX26_08560 [Pelagerythrobacter rhizovicinus]
MRKGLSVLAALALGACATGPGGQSDTLDAIADDYLLLQLTIGEKEEGYIDAYYGPEDVRTRAVAEAAGQTLPMLAARTEALEARAAQFADDGVPGDSLEERRARFLVAQLTAAGTRLRMMQGETLSFADEAEGLFGVRPELPPLESFDPLLAQIERLVPGEGPLWQRIDTFQKRFDMPADRVRPVMDAAIAECKRRTLEHIALPEGESFTLALVTDKPWSGYNYYQGGYHSKIEVNTDLPVRLDRAIDLGCHEGYPGHHAFNSLLERELVNGRGWQEFSVYPLYSPQSLIAEGSANYGIDLAFPGEEDVAFTRDVLAPIAGLEDLDVERYIALRDAMQDLGPARYTIASRYLAGEIDVARATELLQRYQLVSPERAKQSLDFIDTYRSYIINYGLGRDMVQAAIEAGDADEDERWERMERLLSEPALPRDLVAMAGGAD